MINRQTPPHIYSPVEFEYKLPPCSKQILNNGIPLYFVNDCIEPVIQIDLVFPQDSGTNLKKVLRRLPLH
ncbi:hypothetical protein EMGBS15_08460 [Filimonas sp.]|nr:hypothetical protein EMGBS15_08460 [Filimonas sp.]